VEFVSPIDDTDEFVFFQDGMKAFEAKDPHSFGGVSTDLDA